MAAEPQLQTSAVGYQSPGKVDQFQNDGLEPSAFGFMADDPLVGVTRPT